MRCGTCATGLDRPGDYCLVCRSANADAVVVDVGAERATLTMLDGDRRLGEMVVTTTAEDGDLDRRQRRNYAGRIVDEVRRKRPEAVFLAGDRPVVRAVRSDLHQPTYRLSGDDPVVTAIERRNERSPAVVDRPPAEKIGGSHSTVVGKRTGRRVLEATAAHPHVKAVIPGPIERGGSAGGSRGAKVTRADDTGNVRLLLLAGSSVQTIRVITTAMSRDLGEAIADDLSDVLDSEGLQV